MNFRRAHFQAHIFMCFSLFVSVGRLNRDLAALMSERNILHISPKRNVVLVLRKPNHLYSYWTTFPNKYQARKEASVVQRWMV